MTNNMITAIETIKLDRQSSAPLYLQIAEGIKKLIDEGVIAEYTRLLPIRKLAEILTVNQITIVSALKQLEINGYISKKQGSGTYVNRYPGETIWNSQSQFSQAQYYNPQNSQYSQSQYTQYSHVTLSDNTVNFASATPTPDLFPIENFKQALNDVLDRDKGAAFGYLESQGYFPLQESISALLAAQDIPCHPEHLQIISGAQQGIDIVSKSLLRQGDTVITESPTYIGATAVFRSRGANVIDVEIQPDGLNIELLEYHMKKHSPKLVYTIPSFQNPTGRSYSLAKRQALLDLASKYNFYIIEDDYVSDLDFQSRQMPTLKSLDRNDRVIFIKSFSKIFMPGLRLGFMTVPPSINHEIIQAKHTTDISTSGLIQRAFDLYIRRGCWKQLMHYMYGIYKKRYECMVSSLDRCLPAGIEYLKPGGGLNIWVNTPYGFSVDLLADKLSKRGIIFAPGRLFYSHNTPQSINCLRLSFAAVYEDQIEYGIRTLCEEMRDRIHPAGNLETLPIL